MIVTFDVFTKKTRLFYIARAITILTIPLLAAGGIFNVQYKTVFMPLIDTLIILGSLISVSFLIVNRTGLVRTYVKDGELVLTDDCVIIDGTKVPLTEAKNIKLNVGIWTWKRAGNLLSNRIEVTDRNNQTYKDRFVIKSYDLNEDFQKILDQWRTNGVTFDVSYHNVF